VIMPCCVGQVLLGHSFPQVVAELVRFKLVQVLRLRNII
jgi:hypothetical protein